MLSVNVYSSSCDGEHSPPRRLGGGGSSAENEKPGGFLASRFSYGRPESCGSPGLSCRVLHSSTDWHRCSLGSSFIRVA